MGHGGPAANEHRAQVEVEHLVPALGPGVGDIGGEALAAGHVDHHVEPARVLDGGAGGRLHRLLVHDVGDRDQGVGSAAWRAAAATSARSSAERAASTTVAPAAARVRAACLPIRGWPR